MKDKALRPKSGPITAVLILLAAMDTASAQTSFTSTSATGAWNTLRWNNSADGPDYSSEYTANNNVVFSSGNYTFAGMGTSTNVGNITVQSGVNVSFASVGSTFATDGQVRTFEVVSGSSLDFSTQNFSTAAGTGLIKTGGGVLALSGGAYSGGFTLQQGTVIARGVDAFGAGTTNVLTLNAGTLASSANRNFSSAKHGGGIVIGGDVQFGELDTNVSLASSSANLTFANSVSLGAATRTFTIGNNGSTIFDGVISGGTDVGLTIAANPGVTGNITLSGANTYTGATTISSGTLSLGSGGSLDNSTNLIVGNAGSSGAVLDTTEKTTGFTILANQTLSGIGTVNVGAGKTLAIEGTHSVGNSGVGTQNVTGDLSYSANSLFSWDLVAPTSDPGGANQGTYDKMTVSGSVGGSSSVFEIILGGNSFEDAFWRTDKSWSDIFTMTSGSLQSVFTSFGGDVASNGTVAGVGQFSFSGNTLEFAAIPEPTSALAGLLFAAGLMRRSRGRRS